MTIYESIKSIFLVWVIFMAVGVAIRVNHNDMVEGRTKQHYLSQYQGIDVPAEEARFYNININLYDITLKDITVLY